MPGPIRQQAVAAQAGHIADLLGLKIEEMRYDSNGITLDHDQMDALRLALTRHGFQNAIDLLRATANAAAKAGSEYSFAQWSTYTAAALFLEGNQ